MSVMAVWWFARSVVREEAMAQFADIFAVPRSELDSIQPDYEALRERFPWLGFSGFSGNLFAMAAHFLGLPPVAPGDPLALDEEGGLAVFVWSSELVSWLRTATSSQLADLARTLSGDERYLGESEIGSVLARLSAFVQNLPHDSVLVENTTF
jgi:hypothetical protein